MRINRRLRPLCGDAASDRRLDLVHLRHVRRHAPGFLRFDPKTKLSEFYRAAEGGHRRPRRRHRRRTAWCGARAPPAC